MLITPIKVAVNRDRPSEALNNNNVSPKTGGYGVKAHGASFPGGHAGSRRICQLHACAIAGFIIGNAMLLNRSKQAHAESQPEERGIKGGWRGQRVSKLHLQGAIEEWTAICISDWMGAQ